MTKNLDKEGLRSIAADYQLFYIDLWGVIHNGQELFNTSVDCLYKLKNTGYPIILVSNAPRPGEEITLMLEKMGLEKNCYDKIITSGDLTQKILNDGSLGQNCYHIGPDRDLKIFDGVGVNRVSFDKCDFIFITGLFNDEEEDENTYLPLLKESKDRELKLLCANPDIWVQRGNDLIPCAGAISKKYESIGGEVINIGKPFKPIFDEAVKNIEILGKGKCTSTIVIGDGIDTDIKGANDYKLDSLLTLGGLFSGQKIDEVLKVIDNKKIFPSFLIEKLIY